MRFQTIVAPTITELFERQIQGMILSGQVEPGEKLPTEAELAENMHISKSAVHAGIKNLERMGFLRVSPRRGVCCRLGRVRQRGHAHLHIKIPRR